MGFHRPDWLDATGHAQLDALTAVQAQVELSLRRKLRFAGIEYVNRFHKPETDDEALLGYWDALQGVFHTLGGVHIGILGDAQTRGRSATADEPRTSEP